MVTSRSMSISTLCLTISTLRIPGKVCLLIVVTSLSSISESRSILIWDSARSKVVSRLSWTIPRFSEISKEVQRRWQTLSSCMRCLSSSVPILKMLQGSWEFTTLFSNSLRRSTRKSASSCIKNIKIIKL